MPFYFKTEIQQKESHSWPRFERGILNLFSTSKPKDRRKIDPEFLSKATKCILETSWTKVLQMLTEYHRNQGSLSARFSWSITVVL